DRRVRRARDTRPHTAPVPDRDTARGTARLPCRHPRRWGGWTSLRLGHRSSQGPGGAAERRREGWGGGGGDRRGARLRRRSVWGRTAPWSTRPRARRRPALHRRYREQRGTGGRSLGGTTRDRGGDGRTGGDARPRR